MALTRTDLETGKVRHAYASTVHRAQGQTVDTCHYLAAGGGHSLAYVALTRARDASHIHAVADSTAQAVDDFHHHWTHRDTQTWAIDTRATTGATQPLSAPDKLQRARAQAELDALVSLRATLAPQPYAAAINHRHRHQLRRELADLRRGTGAHADTPAGHAARQLNDAQRALAAARHTLSSPTASRGDRRHGQRQLPELEQRHTAAERAWTQHGKPIADDLTEQIHALDASEVAPTLDRLTIDRLDRRITHLRRALDPQLERPAPDLSIER